VIGVQSQPQLFEIIGALHTSSGFPSGLNGRQQKCNQNTNDCDDDKEFNKGKGSYSAPLPQIDISAHKIPLISKKFEKNEKVVSNPSKMKQQNILIIVNLKNKKSIGENYFKKFLSLWGLK